MSSVEFLRPPTCVGVGTLGVIGVILAFTFYAWSSSERLSAARYCGIVRSLDWMYGLIASPFTHLNVLHLLFNCLALADIGFSMEAMLGTVGFLLLYVFNLILSSIFMTIWYFFPLGACGMGTSGVIFALLTYLCYSMQQRYIVLWCIQVPSVLAPWFMLVLVQVFFWNAGFMAHFTGILSGIVSYYLVPEQWWKCSCVDGHEALDVTILNPGDTTSRDGGGASTEVNFLTPPMGKGHRLGST